MFSINKKRLDYGKDYIMQIYSNNNVQFGARYVAPTSVKLKDAKKWKDVSVNFIKFETAKEDDRRTLDQVSRLWGGKNLSSAIADEANILGGNAHIYGVTTQESNFDHVDPSKVLGFVSTDKFTKKAGEIPIFKIGTNPKFAYEQNKRKRSIKHIATSMIEALKLTTYKKANTKIVTQYAEPQEVKFLNKTGVEIKNSNIVEVLA